jgi:hypothetical protein
VKKATIIPVMDHRGIVGLIVEFRPDYVEAYDIDGLHLLGAYSSKVEAAAELVLHDERPRFTH